MNKFNFIFKPLLYLKKSPKLLLPFMILAIFQGIALYLIYMYPQNPFSILFAPPIKKFFGENYLHYPANFIIMPKLFAYSLIALNIFPGILLNAILIGFINDIWNTKTISFRTKTSQVIKKIIPLLLIFILTFYFSKILMIFTPKLLNIIKLKELMLFKDLNIFLTKHTLPNIDIIINFFMDFLSQSVLIYAICIIVIENKNFLSSLLLNFKYFFKLIIPTFLVFTISAFFYLPLLFIKYRLVYIMYKTFPEITVYVLALEILILFILNYFITVSTTVLFLNSIKKNKENNS